MTVDSPEKLIWNALKNPGTLQDLKERCMRFIPAHTTHIGLRKLFRPEGMYPLGRGAMRRLLTKWEKEGYVESTLKQLEEGRTVRVFARKEKK